MQQWGSQVITIEILHSLLNLYLLHKINFIKGLINVFDLPQYFYLLIIHERNILPKTNTTKLKFRHYAPSSGVGCLFPWLQVPGSSFSNVLSSSRPHTCKHSTFLTWVKYYGDRVHNILINSFFGLSLLSTLISCDGS